MINCQYSSNPTSNITTLSNIAAFEPEILHQSIYDPRNVLDSEILIHRRTRRKGIPRERGNDKMIRQIAWVKLIPEQLQKREKFQEASCLK